MQQQSVKVAPLDYAKWLISIVLIAACVVGNVYYGSHAAALRAAAIIIIVIVALLIVKTTTHGDVAWKFFKEARLEVRKVVWPTRQETVQMTVIVAIVVGLMGLILWLVDTLFAYGISHIVT